MWLFKEKKRKKIVRVNAEIAKAQNYLNKIHPVSRIFYGREPYHYMHTSNSGRYVRYHFYKGFDKRLEYIVLSEEERNQKEKQFAEKMGSGYAYLDTIFSDIYGDDVQHRFVGSKGERAYMTDNGTIGEGFMMKED